MRERNEPVQSASGSTLVWVLLGACLLTSGVSVRAEIMLDDPMVRITSLPLGLNVLEVMAKLSDDVARDTGLNKNIVTYYWQTFDAIYCPGCDGAPKSLTMFVDMYAPGFMTEKEIHNVMTSLAAALEKHTGVDRKWVFIYTHVAKEGHTYIKGRIPAGEEVKAFDQENPDTKK